jgi:hypothetical protein
MAQVKKTQDDEDNFLNFIYFLTNFRIKTGPQTLYTNHVKVRKNDVKSIKKSA